MSVIMERWYKRLHDYNQNLVLLIVGGTGTGKTYTALKLAETLDPEFSVDKICFSIRDFFLHMKNRENLGRGSVLVLDEIGVDVDSRGAMTVQNRVSTEFFEIFRKLNLCVILTLPYAEMLDKRLRQLSHAVLLTHHIDRENNQVVLKPLHLDPNFQSGKVYTKYARKRIDNRVKKITRLRVGKPSVQLIHKYEKLKDDFINNFINEGLEKLDRIHNKTVTKTVVNVESLVSKVFEDPEQYKVNGKFSVQMLRHSLKIPHNKAGVLRQLCLKEEEKRQNAHITPQKALSIRI